MKAVWLSPEILDWEPWCCSSSNIEENSGPSRALQHWIHAYEILEQYSDEMHLIDAIATLKRSVDHRSRVLNRAYSFKKIPYMDKRKKILDQLETLGAVRPLMLRQLKDLRNKIEYQDATPPETGRCREIADFVWYFLRSTDRLVKETVTGIELTPLNESSYVLSIWMGPKNDWATIKVSGWVWPSLLSSTETEGWIKLALDRIESREQATLRLKDSRLPIRVGVGRGKNPEDMWVAGVMTLPSTAFLRLAKIYFSV